jgi:tetratricopeptide (TPR) repeat protein
MDSSKEAEPRRWDAELASAELSLEERARRRRLFVGLPVLVLLGIGAVFASRWLRNPEPLLAQARALLTPAMNVKNPVLRADPAKRAEGLLRTYLARNGRQPDSAKILLACALILQQRDASQATMNEQMEVNELVANVRGERCPIEDLLIGGEMLASTGRMNQADEFLRLALERNELRERTLRLAADLCLYLGRDDEVLAHCQELAELRPEDPYPWTLMSRVYVKRRFPDKVVQVTRKLLELDPEQHESRHLLIESLIEVGNKVDARRECEFLRAKAPRVLAEHPVTEARLLHLEGRSPEALVMVERVLQEKPADADALLLAGKIRLAGSDQKGAIVLLEKLVQADPTYEEAHYLLGQAYARQGNQAKAEEHLQMHRKVLDLKVKLYRLEREAAMNPNNMDARQRLVALYEELGWKERADYWRRVVQAGGAFGAQ